MRHGDSCVTAIHMCNMNNKIICERRNSAFQKLSVDYGGYKMQGTQSCSRGVKEQADRGMVVEIVWICSEGREIRYHENESHKWQWLVKQIGMAENGGQNEWTWNGECGCKIALRGKMETKSCQAESLHHSFMSCNRKLSVYLKFCNKQKTATYAVCFLYRTFFPLGMGSSLNYSSFLFHYRNHMWNRFCWWWQWTWITGVAWRLSWHFFNECGAL